MNLAEFASTAAKAICLAADVSEAKLIEAVPDGGVVGGGVVGGVVGGAPADNNAFSLALVVEPT